ncbi:MAG: hypothetical protein ACYC4K_07595 [Thiobacillus sp.]
MNAIPWAALKTSSVILLVVVLITGTGVWWSANMLKQAEAARLQQHQANQAAKQKLQRSNSEKQLIEQHRDAYQALVTRGFVGRENRLAWLEAVQQANRDARLYGLDYSLEPRTVVQQPDLTVPLGQTVMRIRMPMLVEDDLANFLSALQQRSTGIFRVRSCQIARSGEGAPQPINKPELETECELLWFTIATSGASS